MFYHPEFCKPIAFIFALLWYSPENHWKIHGLWPETCEKCNNCGYPSYCRNGVVQYNKSLLDPLQTLIEKRWYPDRDLIKHEWLKHGSCDGNITEFGYFNTTLDLWHCVDFTSMCTNYVEKKECWIWLKPQDIIQCTNHGKRIIGF